MLGAASPKSSLAGSSRTHGVCSFAHRPYKAHRCTAGKRCFSPAASHRGQVLLKKTPSASFQGVFLKKIKNDEKKKKKEREPCPAPSESKLAPRLDGAAPSLGFYTSF